MLQRSDLYQYQVKLGERAKQSPFVLNAVSMGLGKTVSWLTAFVDMLNSFDARHALVVAPKRVARKVWTDEIKRWSHLNGLTASVVVGTPQQRWDALQRRADIHLVNRDVIPWVEAQFLEGTGKKLKQLRPWPWDTVVLDESQSFKNPTGVRFNSLRNIRRLHEVQRLHELTGTPTPNGYIDLWGQVFLLDQGKRLGATIDAYRERWFDASYEGHSYKIKSPQAKAEIQALLADITLVMRAEDYLGAPNVVYNNVMVELPPKARDVYQRMKRKYIAEFLGTKITAVNSAVLTGKLLQLANGTVYDDNRHPVITHDEKIDAMLELLDGADGPVMIAYAFVHDKARIEEALTTYCRDGGTWRALDTEQDEDDWNAGKIDFLLLHPASAGHGLNLQHSGAETIIWFGLTANGEWYQQLNARLIGGHRATGRLTVVHRILAENTYDLEVAQLLNDKDFTQDELTSALLRLAGEAS